MSILGWRRPYPAEAAYDGSEVCGPKDMSSGCSSFGCRRSIYRWRGWPSVRRGGHFVPDEDVRRRFGRGLLNLREAYRSVVDSLILFENETYPPRIIAFEELGRLQVIEPVRFAVAWQDGAADG